MPCRRSIWTSLPAVLLRRDRAAVWPLRVNRALFLFAAAIQPSTADDAVSHLDCNLAETCSGWVTPTPLLSLSGQLVTQHSFYRDRTSPLPTRPFASSHHRLASHLPGPKCLLYSPQQGLPVTDFLARHQAISSVLIAGNAGIGCCCCRGGGCQEMGGRGRLGAPQGYHCEVVRDHDPG